MLSLHGDVIAYYEILSGLHKYIDCVVILFSIIENHMNDSYGFLFDSYQF